MSTLILLAAMVSAVPAALPPAAGYVLSVEEMDRLEGEKGTRPICRDQPSVGARPGGASHKLDLSPFLPRWRPHRVNLAPAKWIWLPSQRTLPNTFVLFRREVDLKERPRKAAGWITADSRYRLTVNGRRVQWGPAPCDPRNLDVDPVDLTPLLKPGKNVLGVEVLYYGQGDGTWPAGKPGMIFNLTIQYEDGRRERIVSDASWQAAIDRAHRPGQYKRWFLRALQEEFDARLHPAGWDTAAGWGGSSTAAPTATDSSPTSADSFWTAAMPLRCPPDKPAACCGYSYVGTDTIEHLDPNKSCLRMRQIPLLVESEVPAMRLAESGRVHWRRDPADWFEFRMPDCFHAQREQIAVPKGEGAWQLPAAAGPREGLFRDLRVPRADRRLALFLHRGPGGDDRGNDLPGGARSGRPGLARFSQFFNWSRLFAARGSTVSSRSTSSRSAGCNCTSATPAGRW